MAKLFISYRRSDSQHAVDRLYQELAKHVAEPQSDIFMDVDNIPLGVDFVDYLSGKVTDCDTLLCIIGPDWLGEIQRRADDPKDFVRVEIEAALARSIPVVPILLDGAPVPSEAELPPSIRALSRRNGTELRRQTFDANVETLARGLGLVAEPAAKIVEEPKQELQAGPTRHTPSKPFQLVFGGGLVAGAMLLVGVQGVQMWSGNDGETETSEETAVVSKDAPETNTPSTAPPPGTELKSEETAVIARPLGAPVQGPITNAVLERTLSGHEGAVQSVAFSPDGTRILTGSRDKTARIWDARTGNLIETLNGHESAVQSVAFSPDGAKVATGDDGIARIWDTYTGSLIDTLIEHEGRVLPVAFSPDEAQTLTGFDNNTAAIWGKIIRYLNLGPRRSVPSLAFSPDGKYIATVAADSLWMWDARTGSVIERVRGHEGQVSSVDFSSDGTRILTGSDDNTAKIWTVVRGD